MIDDSMQMTFSKNQEVYKKLKPIIAKLEPTEKAKKKIVFKNKKVCSMDGT
jgi:hypothetical protein